MFGRSSGKVAVAVAVAVIAAAPSLGVAQAGKDGMGKASSPKSAMAMDAVEYTLVFKSTWQAAQHPVEYPTASLVSGPHFSGIIGAAHNASYSLFKAGSLPTAGLERLSEEGKHSPLDEEIKAAVMAGNAASLFTTGPLKDFKDPIMATFRVDPAHPVLSFVAMIAPSPDWFAGASVNLWDNGQWAASRTIQVYAYDSGGDDGMTYKAADMDNVPKKPTMQATSRHFAPNGTPVPVGTVTITRK